MKKLLIIPLLFLLTGCWNYHELNELAIITGVAIDFEDEEYKTTVLISNAKKGSSPENQASPSTTAYEGKGKNIYESLEDAASSISKKAYYGHMEVLILSEDILKQDIKKTLDFLFRYPQTRNEFYVVIAKNNKAGDVLKITTPLESFPSQNIAQNLEVSEEQRGFVYAVTFNEFVSSLLEKGNNPILPSIEIVGDLKTGTGEDNLKETNPTAYLKLSTLGLFKDNKFITWADKEESEGINIINNKVQIAKLTSPCNEAYTVTELSKLKTKVDYKDNKFTIKIKATGNILEVACDVDLTDNEEIKKIEQKNIERIKELCDKAILLSKENKTDVFGFGNMIYKKNPNYFKEIENIWEDELFLNIDVEYDIDLKLEAKGNINNYMEENNGNN